MAAAVVRIPTLLGQLTGGAREIEVEAASVGEALHALFEMHPQLRVHVLDERGAVRPHVALFHGDRRIGEAGLEEALAPGDAVTVLQAVSGG